MLGRAEDRIVAVKPIPDGYQSVTPYLIVDDGYVALEFYKNAFGAVERMRVEWPGGTLGHCELVIGNSVIMMASEFPSMGALSPKSVGGTPVSLMIYTESVDEVFARALAGGSTEVHPVRDQFYGDRTGTLEDPFGHRWTIATHVEDVPPDELKRRSDAMAAQMSSQAG